MNNTQRAILIAALVALVIAVIFVPTVTFYSDGTGGNYITYRPVFEEQIPAYLGGLTVVRFDIVLVEIIGIGVAGGIGYLLAKK